MNFGILGKRRLAAARTLLDFRSKPLRPLEATHHANHHYAGLSSSLQFPASKPSCLTSPCFNGSHCMLPTNSSHRTPQLNVWTFSDPSHHRCFRVIFPLHHHLANLTTCYYIIIRVARYFLILTSSVLSAMAARRLPGNSAMPMAPRSTMPPLESRKRLITASTAVRDTSKCNYQHLSHHDHAFVSFCTAVPARYYQSRA